MFRNLNAFNTSTLAALALAAVTATAAAPAYALVPGSDTFERAQDSAAIQSVIENRTARSDRSEPPQTRAYGYPENRRPGALVPGSSRVHDAADAQALQSVIESEPAVRASERAGALVPGSDSF